MSTLAMFFIAYGLIALAALRPLTGHFAYTFMRRHNEAHSYRTHKEPNGEQWFGSFCLALAIVCVWPAILAWNAIGGRWQIGAERQHVIQEQKKRLRELERELDLT